MAKKKGKNSKFLIRALRVLLILALIAAAGIDWYLVFLLNQSPPDYWRLRKFAGIAGGFLFSIAILLVAVFVLMFFTGSTFLAKGLFSFAGIYFIFIFVLVWVVFILNFKIMPSAKYLAGEPNATEEEIAAARKHILNLAIAAASVGTVIVFLYLMAGIIRAIISSKQEKAEEEEKDTDSLDEALDELLKG
jgi:hypothetical protein